MASAIKFKIHGPLDDWSTREKLALACSVLRNGDQNWVSVSRAIKPFGENNRPPEWFSQRNCAIQYTDLLEKVETPKRKRGDRGEIETPQLQIIRQLAVDRAEELKKHVVEYQQRYKKLKRDLECIKSGQWDDKLPDIWQQIQKEKLAKEAALMKEKKTDVQEEEEDKAKTPDVISEDTNQDIIIDTTDLPQVQSEKDEISVPVSKPLTLDIKKIPSDDKTKPTPPSSPLLSTLLQSSKFSVDSLQQLKQEVEQKDQLQAQQQAAAATKNLIGSTKQSESTTSGEITESDKTSGSSLTKKSGRQSTEKTEANVDNIVKSEDIETEKEVQVKVEVELDDTKTEEGKDESVVEEEIEVPVRGKSTLKVEDEDSQESVDAGNATFISVDEEISIKEEPMSPASSESSKISECDIKMVINRRGKGGRSRGGRKPLARNKKSVSEEEKKGDVSSQLTDGDTSDDDGQESDDTAAGSSSIANTSITATFSESIPNSPLSHCSDTEDDKAHKNWKKSIMLVWRMAANHKYANVFLHQVTNEIAPGYQRIVNRPTDLTTIKKNVESGIIRTTQEFQRDMMLMFTNAIMYNNCNHNVHKMAVEMYDDVMTHIEQYVSAQLMLQSSESKSLRPSRRTESSDKSDKEDDQKRRRTLSESHQEGGKSKKRKTRGDDT